jgi:uncharacterized membrane protein
MRTLSLVVDAEGESEQNDVKILHEKLDNTTKQVQALSTQLKELREQVQNTSVEFHLEPRERRVAVGWAVIFCLFILYLLLCRILFR